MRAILLTLALCLMALKAGHSHEFWIMPEAFEVEPGQEADIHLREGEDFVGKPISFHSRRFHQFELLSPQGQSRVQSRNDAVPAARLSFDDPGLNVLIYQSKLGLITYTDMAKFERFLKGKRLDWGIQQHIDRQLPETEIREAYFRYAKALVQVGNSEQGSDKLIGMPLELVALDNPYRTRDTMRVQLHYKNQPYGEQWLFVFHRGTDGVDKQWYQTDQDGIATIPLSQGGQFQINAVHMQPASDRMNDVFGAVWQTLWASMTLELSS